jgi:hypothetical protein
MLISPMSFSARWGGRHGTLPTTPGMRRPLGFGAACLNATRMPDPALMERH